MLGSIQTLNLVGTLFVASRQDVFSMKDEVSERRKDNFSCLHLVVCVFGHHDRFSISRTGDIEWSEQQ